MDAYGKQATSTSFVGFMDGLLQVLSSEMIDVVAADRGFSDIGNLEYREDRGKNCITVFRLHDGLL